MSTTLTLLAAVLRAPAPAVARWIVPELLEDVALTDAPAAEVLRVAADLAAAGTAPDPVTIHAEMLRRGLLAGHPGDLVKSRLLDATTATAWPERIHEYSTAVLAEVFRLRLSAAGEAIAGAADAAESDAWQTVVSQGAALRISWERLARLRGAEVIDS